MEGLVRAIAEFFAAILSTVGYVGKPRQRIHIRDNLKLLTELADHPDVGRGSWPHQALLNRVALDVARLAGVDTKNRKVPWASVVLAAVIGAPLGYLTYWLDKDGFVWYSIFPGTAAVLMGMAVVGMIISPPEEQPTETPDQMVINPLAGDVNAEPSADD